MDGGRDPVAAAFQQSFFLNPSRSTSPAACCPCCVGVASVYGVWRLGTRLWSATAGLAAAFFLAVAPFAVRDAHYVKHDVPTTAALIATLIAIVSLAEAREADRGRRMWVAATLAGLATSMHYYAVFVGVPLAMGLWLAWSDRTAGSVRRAAGAPRLAALVKATAIAAVAFLLGSPFLLVEPLTAIRDIRANRQIVIDRAVESAARWFPSAGDYARMLAVDAVGWPIGLLAVAGIVSWRDPGRA